MAHEEYGRLPLAEVMAPAIRLADGYALSREQAERFNAFRSRFEAFESTARYFAPEAGVRSGRDVPPARPRGRPAPHRREGPRRVLHRRDGGRDRGGDGARRWPHHARGPRGLPRRRAGARDGHVPRAPRDLDAAAVLWRRRADPTPARAGAARRRRQRLQLVRDDPPHGRGDAPRLRRPRGVAGRPRLHARPGRGADLRRLRAPEDGGLQPVPRRHEPDGDLRRSSGVRVVRDDALLRRGRRRDGRAARRRR